MPESSNGRRGLTDGSCGIWGLENSMGPSPALADEDLLLPLVVFGALEPANI